MFFNELVNQNGLPSGIYSTFQLEIKDKGFRLFEGEPLGFVSIVFGNGVLLQSARFSPVVNFFYGGMLYVAGIWQDVFFQK